MGKVKAHELSSANATLLLDVLNGDTAVAGVVLAGPVTVLLATNRPGKLPPALRSRFAVRLDLTPYSPVAMREILAAMAEQKHLLVSPQARTLLAQLCHGIPRRAEQLLDNLRRYLGAKEIDGTVDVGVVRAFMKAFGIDEQGLELADRRYLRCLRDRGVLSLETLAGVLQIDAASVRAIEIRLLPLGLVVIERTGRRITEAGRHWLDQTSSLDGEDN